MEDALRDSVGEFRGFFDNVLILVLMEDALRDVVKNPKNGKLFCLNPCSNGRCSARIKTMTYLKLEKSLNPCSNGRCSARTLSMMTKNSPICLNPCSNGRCSARANFKTYWLSVGYNAFFLENPLDFRGKSVPNRSQIYEFSRLCLTLSERSHE